MTRWILGLALVLRLAYAMHSGALLHPQVWEQEQIATNLIERHEFLFVSGISTYRSYAEPLYPFLAAAVYLLTGHSRTALVLVQILIGTATVWLVGRTAGRTARSSNAGHVAALIAATHPGLIHYASVLHTLVLDAFFFTLCGALLVDYMESRNQRVALAAGAAIGLGALARPTVLLFLPMLCWAIASKAVSAKVALRQMVIVSVVACAFVAPWTLRNAAIHHVFMLTRSGTGFVFWLGNNPQSSGSAIADDGRPILKLAPPELLQQVRYADEVERDRIFTRTAWSYIRTDRMGALRRFAQRLGEFWWFSARWGRLFSPTVRLIYRVWWAAILSLVVLGGVMSIVAASPGREGIWILLAAALIVSIGQSVYYVEGRHRLAIETLLFPAAAFGAVVVGRKISASQNHRRGARERLSTSTENPGKSRAI